MHNRPFQNPLSSHLTPATTAPRRCTAASTSAHWDASADQSGPAARPSRVPSAAVATPSAVLTAVVAKKAPHTTAAASGRDTGNPKNPNNTSAAALLAWEERRHLAAQQQGEHPPPPGGSRWDEAESRVGNARRSAIRQMIRGGARHRRFPSAAAGLECVPAPRVWRRAIVIDAAAEPRVGRAFLSRVWRGRRCSGSCGVHLVLRRRRYGVRDVCELEIGISDEEANAAIDCRGNSIRRRQRQRRPRGVEWALGSRNGVERRVPRASSS